MRDALLAEIERIAGDRLTPHMRKEIAEAAVRIVDEKTKADALKAMETVREHIEATTKKE